MKFLRVAGTVFFAGALLAARPASAEKIAAMPAPAGYVDDYAGVLSAPAKTEIEGLCREVHDKTRAQVFLVTIKTLDGEAVETFANELFHNWKIGEKKTDRGVLLLLAINDHKRWIEVGYGFEGILNDAKVGDIGREMVPALKASHYDEAARIGVRDISRAIAADSGVAIAGLSNTPATEAASPNESTPPAPDGLGRSISTLPAWALLLLPGVFILVFALVIWGMMTNRRRGLGGGYSDAGWGSGSSFSSGSDSSGSSSSSDSFSGGDGGDSGGGGAGGDW